MNKKHFSKVGKYIGMACLLFACAMAQSCRDEYFYDDREPDFLGSSIYNYLKEQGKFTMFLRVIDDLDYDEVLAKTGSKTLFVADDEAFKKGIREEWGIDDYKQLTTAHKRIILNSAMLDNAYLLEMLSKMQSVGSNAEPVPGQCVRRETSASVIDTIGLFVYEQLPQNNPYWNIFNPNDSAFWELNARLTIDKTPAMMSHFVQDYLYQEGVKESDLQEIVGGKTASWSDIYIYDKKVIREKSDVTCKNGYVHQLDGLLIPPSNMAELLRKNVVTLDGRNVSDCIESGSVTENAEELDSTTYIFSRMLDRFSFPEPISNSSDLADAYYLRYPERAGEQLYDMQYFVEGKKTKYVDIWGKEQPAIGSLLFNPGWNAYEGDGTKKERDMAAIFAPSDQALISYFTDPTGSGRDLIERYGQDFEADERYDINKKLLNVIDNIPLPVLQSLVRNHMQLSFVNSVPSKFRNLVDDARDDLNATLDDVQKTMLASNGIVYVTNRVYRPARLASVIAPVMLDDSLYVFNQLIKEYDSYLLSMKNKFSLIVSPNGNMSYYDPYSEINTRLADRTIYKLMRVDIEDEKTGVVNSEVKVKAWTYDDIEGEFVEAKDYSEGVLDGLAKEIMEYNIVLGDMNSTEDIRSKRKYYESKGYGNVKVQRNDDGYVTHIAGGRELQHGTMTPLLGDAIPRDNGYTFKLDGTLIQPSTRSVYDVLKDSVYTQFNRFYNDLCDYNGEVLIYLLGSEKDENRAEWNKFRIFKDKLVTMFNTYKYTVYVPTEEALETAYSQGLKTWPELYEEYVAIKGLPENEAKERKAQLKADAYLIAKFVRYHFQTGSVFVDNPPHALVTQGEDPDYVVKYSTSSLNDSTSRFSKVTVQTDVEKNTLAICGDFGESEDASLENYKNVCRVINADPDLENKTYNVMTRDIKFSGNSINTSSYAVVHLIDNFLVYGGKGGIYDADNQKFIKYVE